MMSRFGLRRTMVIGGLLALAAVFAPEANAAPAGGSDKSIAAKKGVGESLGNKEFDDNKLPGKLEVGLALGSIVGAVAAIKWL